MRFHSMIHGIDIDKAAKEVHEEATQSMLFGDPKDYEKLSDEERERRTKDMMRYHRGWIRDRRTSIKEG